MNGSEEFEALRREYIQSARQKCRDLEEAAASLRRGDPVDLKALRQLVHKLRGSGGFYGFQALSAAAGKAEDQLILVLDGECPRDDQALAGLVEQVAAELKAAGSAEQ